MENNNNNNNNYNNNNNNEKSKNKNKNSKYKYNKLEEEFEEKIIYSEDKNEFRNQNWNSSVGENYYIEEEENEQEINEEFSGKEGEEELDLGDIKLINLKNQYNIEKIQQFDEISISPEDQKFYNSFSFKDKLIKFIIVILSSVYYCFKQFILILKKPLNKNKILNIWKSLIRYSINNIKRNKLNFTIGFISCFLVVFLVSAGLSILSNISLIYLSQADYESGGVDVLITPIKIKGLTPKKDGTPNYQPSLNFTVINQLLSRSSSSTFNSNEYSFDKDQIEFLKELNVENYNNNSGDNDDFSNITPRSNSIGVYIYPTNNCKIPINNLNYRYHPNNLYPECFYCLETSCSTENYTSLRVIDFKRENQLGFNTTFGFESLPEGSLLISNRLGEKLKLNIGDSIYLRINPYLLFPQMWTNSKPDLTKRYKDIYGLYKIYGFYSNEAASSILLDYSTLSPYISTQVDPEFSNFTKQYLYNSNPYDYIDNIAMKFPNPRLEMYKGTDLDKTFQRVVKYTSKVLYLIGFQTVQVKIPVMDQLYKSKELSSNLGLLLNIIVFVFTLSSILLIYTTLMVDVDTMTYSNGVFRMIGGSLYFIVRVMVSKTLIFAIPSIVFGLLFSQFFLMIASKKLKEYSGEDIQGGLTLNSILYSLLFGFVIPAVSLILPINKAIKKSLSESIDTNRSKLKGVKITITKNDSSEFRFNIAIIGLCLSIIGFSTYFILPRAMVSGNIKVVMDLIFLLILISLLGALFLMVNLHMVLSKIIIFIMTIFDSRAIRSIVNKNILAHKHKNRNTVFMFGVSISLIVMISTLYRIQMDMEQYEYRDYIGSYIKIENDLGYFKQSTTEAIFNRLDELKQATLIHDYSYTTREFNLLSNPQQTQYISNLGRIYQYPVDVYGISPSFYKNTFKDLLKISNVDKSDKDFKYKNQEDLSTLLYSKDSMTKGIIGSALKDLVGTSYKLPFLLDSKVVLNVSGSSKTIQSEEGTTTTIPITPYKGRYVLKPLAFLDASPLYYFSKNPNHDHQSLLLSLPSYQRFTSGYYDSVRDIQIKSFHLTPIKTDKQSLKELIKQLDFSSYIDSVYSIDIYKNEEKYQNSNKINSIFFNFATVISMLISSFSLISSMYTNITEQTKEIGILRAMGLSKFKINRIYLIEAFSLSFGSCILAIIVGLFISWTVILEQVIISEIPLSFNFPYSIVIVVFISSIIISLLSVLSPINKLLNNSIINIIRK